MRVRALGIVATIPLVTALVAGACQTDHESSGLDAWPDGADPAVAGRRIAENWIDRPFLFESGAQDRYGRHVHYAEIVTWYGALGVAELLADEQLERRLVAKFDDLLGVHGVDRISREPHVDFSVAGALPLQIYLQTGDASYREQGLGFADRQWTDPNADGISREARYWADDLYMLPLLQLQAYRATGEQVYMDRAALTMATYLDELQEANGLFHHGAGSPFYWGRGNGWVAAGMTEMLRSLPADHPQRPAVVAGYRTMMAALLQHQSTEGLWRQLIDRPESWVESSGSAMFAFAIVTGVKEGWLDTDTYTPVARRAWLGLVDRLDADANLSDICVGTGKAVGEVGEDLDAQHRFYIDRPRTTGDLHGQAPMLWTAAALMR